MGSHGRIRIKDIARLAQVSTGTVDRVLHGRGEVSESNREKINKIIHDLKYKPNILARSLAGKQDIRLASVLPDYVAGAYWEMPGSGMDKALTELSLFRLTLDRYFFDLSDPASFENAAAAALSTLPDGVIMAPMFPGPAAAFSDRLTEAGIPYVYIDSSLASGKPLAYYGQHSYRSGYALAHLLLGGLQAGAELFLFHGASPEEETNQSAREVKVLRDICARRLLLANTLLLMLICPCYPKQRVTGCLLNYGRHIPGVRCGRPELTCLSNLWVSREKRTDRHSFGRLRSVAR
jgi:LacI family transcriptional regulator